MMQQTKKEKNSTVLFLLPAPVLHSPCAQTCSSLGKSVLCDVTRGSDAPLILSALGMLSSGDPYSFQDN